MLSQLASIASLIVSWAVSSHCYTLVTPLIPIGEPWKDSVSVLILFFVTLIAIRLIAKMICGAVHQTKLKEFDRQMGALFGLLKGFLICLLLTFFAVISTDQSRSLVLSSRSGPFLVRVISTIQKYVPENANHAKIREALEQFAESATKEGASIEPVSLADEVDSVKAKLGDIIKKEAEEAAERAVGLHPERSGDSGKRSASEETEPTNSGFLSTLKEEIDSFWEESRTAGTGTSSTPEGQNVGVSRGSNPVFGSSPQTFAPSPLEEDESPHANSGSILDRQTFSAASTAPPF